MESTVYVIGGVCVVIVGFQLIQKVVCPIFAHVFTRRPGPSSVEKPNLEISEKTIQGKQMSISKAQTLYQQILLQIL